MTKSGILISCCLLLCACSSAPKRDLTTRSGVISAYFNIHAQQFDKVAEMGMEEDETLSLLIVATTTSLTVDDIVMRVKSGYLTADIISESGLDPELVQSKLDKLKAELSKY